MTDKHRDTASASTEPGALTRSSEGVTRRTRRGRSIAITGTSSSLGHRLVAELAEADYVARIVVLDTVHPGVTGSKVSFYALDLTQPAVDARLTEVLQAERVDTFV